MSYICNICGASFDRPLAKKTINYIDGRPEVSREEYCPLCLGYYFSPADACPKCGAAKKRERILCRDCAASLLESVNEFFDGLTEDEEEQFDAWMDGNSIHSRAKWR